MSGRLYAIVLAAGAGRRFGGDKLLAPLGGSPLIVHAVRAALASPARRIFLVTGHDPEGVAAAAKSGVPTDENGRLQIVHAESYAEGMGASLRTAVAVLPADADGVFIFLGDMPHVPHNLAGRLAAAIGDGPAAYPVSAGKRGHPSLLAAELFAELKLCEGDRGAKAVLDRLGARAIQVETNDPGIFLDVDRPEDLRRLDG